MAGTDKLRTWSLATFRAASFIATAVLIFHSRGTLALTLSRLGTGIGFVLFAAFWLATWIATRLGLRHAGRDSWGDDASIGTVMMSTTIAGAWNGVIVLAVLVVGFFATVVRTQGLSAVSALPVVFFGLVLGGAIAFATGAVAGLLYGVVDLIVLLVSGALLRWTQT